MSCPFLFYLILTLFLILITISKINIAEIKIAEKYLPFRKYFVGLSIRNIENALNAMINGSFFDFNEEMIAPKIDRITSVQITYKKIPLSIT